MTETDHTDAVTIERPDDERIEIYVHGQLVASANYDEHGWSGMDAVERTALAVARALTPDGLAATLAQISDEADQLDADLAAGLVSDRLGDPLTAASVPVAHAQESDRATALALLAEARQITSNHDETNPAAALLIAEAQVYATLAGRTDR